LGKLKYNSHLTLTWFAVTHNRDPDIFLGVLNVFAGATSIAWIHYTSTGGGNDNAIVMFGMVLAVNCIGACSVFYRRRVKWSREKIEAAKMPTKSPNKKKELKQS
jgi:hypothetical protein